VVAETRTVFIARKIPGLAEEIIRAAGHEVVANREDRALSAEEFATQVQGSDAALTLLHDKVTAGLIASAPRCRMYANFAVGYDNFDVAAATAAGVALSNTPDVLTVATAELAWALLLGAGRRLGESERLVRRGEFHGWGPLMLLGSQVSGRTLGIVGAGRIGAAVARMSRGFDMRILYTRRSGPSPEMEELGGQHVRLAELLAVSDFVSVHTPLTAETRHLIGAAELRAMKPTAVLVNTSRGPVIDEAALAEALEQRWIAAAGLDVYEREPAIEPRLTSLENVVLAPHIGSATHEARNGMAELAALSILDFLGRKVPRNCINPEYAKAANSA